MIIRSAAYDDAGVILSWMNTEQIWQLDNPEPYQPKSMAAFEKQWSAIIDQQQVFVLEHAGKPIGHMGWVVQTPEIAEFYIVIGESKAWGQGFGATAMQHMFSLASAQGLHALYGRVLGENQRALTFFINQGFTLTATTQRYYQRHGQYFDLHWIARRLSSEANPALVSSAPFSLVPEDSQHAVGAYP